MTKDHAIRLAVAQVPHGKEREAAIRYLCENPNAIRKSLGKLLHSVSNYKGLRPRQRRQRIEMDAWANRNNK